MVTKVARDAHLFVLRGIVNNWNDKVAGGISCVAVELWVEQEVGNLVLHVTRCVHSHHDGKVSKELILAKTTLFFD